MKIKNGLLIVISGPSGVGKKTVLTPLMSDKSLKLVYSISMTTRDKRFDEIQGKDYFFLTKAQFEKEIKKNNLLEWATYVNNYYGTPKQFVNNLRANGENVLLEIEPNGALQIMEYAKKNNDKNVLTIFIAPESIEHLKQHLLKRGTEDIKKINARIKQSKWELTLVNKYDHVIINKDPLIATQELRNILIKKIENNDSK